MTTDSTLDPGTGSAPQADTTYGATPVFGAPAAPGDEGTRPLQHDARRPPRWWGKALAMAVLAVFVGIFAWGALGALQGLLVNLLIAFFIALALEPIVVWLVRHGWKRGGAAAAALLGGLAVTIVVFALFGNLFVQQLVQLVGYVPDLYTSAEEAIESRFGVDVPAVDELVRQGAEEWGGEVASGALLVGTTILGAVFAALTILLVTYYLLAAGPRFRASICRWLTPGRQQEVLRLWEVTQVKVSDFINTRIVLAAIATATTFAFLAILGTPYSLPLALFTGVVSQFVPTIGTYIGGALPVAVALTSQGFPQALGVLAFILGYQQIENLWLAPKVSARALEMNAAVSFVVVLAFGAVFGALGAFLALPIAATVQAVANTYVQRHELVRSHMLHDPGEGDDEDAGDPEDV
ncbi:AI-2E family transporter [Cellulomonas xiejunii]|uniref:AI-2E family transporter n=1 Tax=Cellulomonas xiejunii TaxID=2968083 RepID=A0ABY5KMF4_9CELL|nr:AI-2E family transporter [Cellulomonas xiejunii]MCC2321062.1 AI-2E family transporter [Cellulomonas xiejunii]UUI71656.1 AI-2E family transporter [Cellulomonas xiejunii]